MHNFTCGLASSASNRRQRGDDESSSLIPLERSNKTIGVLPFCCSEREREKLMKEIQLSEFGGNSLHLLES